MSTSKEIKGRIGSVTNIKKITNAMELIAASKLRPAMNRMEASRPYAQRIREVIGHVAGAHPEYTHDFMKVRDVNRVGMIIISTDRGFCGSLNNNLFKKVLKDIQAFQKQNVEVDLALIGHRSETFFSRLGMNIASYAHHLGDKPSITDILGSVKIMLDAYRDGKIDQLNLYYNLCVNTITQEPTLEQLLPISPDATGSEKDQVARHWDYIYEPDAKELLDLLLTRYIESQVYQAMLENIASGQAATMVAMKNATENASEMIDDLKLQYNKARQAAITKELAEIVSGSDAV